MVKITKQDELERYNVWTTTDVKGSPEVEDSDRWLSVKQALHLREEAIQIGKQEAEKDLLICHKCKGVVLSAHMGKQCPYCKEWLYTCSSGEALQELKKEVEE